MSYYLRRLPHAMLLILLMLLLLLLLLLRMLRMLLLLRMLRLPPFWSLQLRRIIKG